MNVHPSHRQNPEPPRSMPGVATPEPPGVQVETRYSKAAAVVFDLLDPIPYGVFVAAFIFDGVYANTAQVLWFKASAWLIAMGLLFAVVPRFINLARVWFPVHKVRPVSALVGFWFSLFGIVAATVNAFVHSRDAFGVMPEGLWLSGLTLLLLVIAKVFPTLNVSSRRPLP